MAPNEMGNDATDGATNGSGIPATGPVWGMGFDDRLPTTVGVRWLDGNYDEIAYVDTTMDREGDNPFFDTGRLNSGRRVHTEHLPTRLRWSGPKKRVPDVIWGAAFFVNDAFKDTVERFEPGVHQFEPVQFEFKDGTPFSQRMWFLHACNRLDTVSRKHSTAEKSRIFWKPETGTMVFSLDRIGGHHLWVDKHVYAAGAMFVSNALHDALIEADIKGLSFERLDTEREA